MESAVVSVIATMTDSWSAVQETASQVMTEFVILLMTAGRQQQLQNQGPPSPALLSAIIFSLLTVGLILFLIVRKYTARVRATILPDPTKPRFRKRDKVLFFGRQMLRKVRSSLLIPTSGLTAGGGSGNSNSRKGRKRQMVLRFAKRLLRLRKDTPLSLLVKEPSQAFLEEASAAESRDTGLPKEVVYMLRGIRVFGLFDKPLFLEMCKRLEFVTVPRGKFLFSIGDPDDSIYIVQVGRMEVTVQESDGCELTLKEVGTGETIVSLLSIMDLLSGHLSPFKTVSAKAIQDSIVIRLQAYIFKDLLEKHPESLVRIVQVIMVRVQRVMFTALHDYLGLTSQLVIPGPLSPPVLADRQANGNNSTNNNRKISSVTSFPGATAAMATAAGPSSDLMSAAANSPPANQTVTSGSNKSPSRRVSVLHQMRLERQRSMTAGEARDLCNNSCSNNILFESSGEQSDVSHASKNSNASHQLSILNPEPVVQQSSSTTTTSTTTITGEAAAEVPANGEDTISEMPSSSSTAATTATTTSSRLRLTNPHLEKMRRKRSLFGCANEERLLSMSETEVMHLAVEGFTQQLGLDDSSLSLIRGKVRVVDFPTSGTCVTEEESRDKSACLFYVLTGCLVVSQKNAGSSGNNCTTGYSRSSPSNSPPFASRDRSNNSSSSNNSSQDHEDKDSTILYHAYPGELVGALAVITGEVSAFTTRTKGPCRLALMGEEDAYSVMKHCPQSVLHLGHTVVRRLSPFARQIDFALDWSNYESGAAIYRQGDPTDSTFIVLSGRLRSVVQRSSTTSSSLTSGGLSPSVTAPTLDSSHQGKKELVGEYGRGDLVGIVELLTQRERSTTVVSVRDSELAKLPAGLLDVIKIKYPVVVTRLIHLLGHRILGSIEKVNSADGSLSPSDIGSRPTGGNFATVALVSVSEDVPLSNFSLELTSGISSAGHPALLLTSDLVRKTLGPSVLDTVAEYRLSAWLAQQEDRHRIVLYQCDSSLSTWTHRCIRQADCILIVGLADNEATVGRIEKQLESIAVRTQKELVLLHREDAERPSNTVKWLNIRSWCSSFHHIRCPKHVFSSSSNRSSVGGSRSHTAVSTAAATTSPDIHSDIARLGRFLTGTSIGLVLGGGGARGAAHVGMIRAIRESGIPIDMVGGVSIGAFMGALYCQEMDVEQLRQKGRKWSFLMTSVWHQILDLTYPASAMFTGAGFNKTIRDTFNETQIEDLWLPYFALTTDITSSQPRVHRFGSLWRYVRASMSLSGYLPPLCDPVDGHLLLDGGYVNNLPADVMREVMGAETILAVDVGSQDDTEMTNFGDELSGWWLLYNRWNPFCHKVKVPTLPEIQLRLAYVSCVRRLEEVKRSNYCTYIRPPIDVYKTLQFGSFDQILDIGYQHGKALFSAMSLAKQKSLNSYLQKERQHVYQQQGLSLLSPPSFVDLAEKVCRVQRPVTAFSSSVSSDFLKNRPVVAKSAPFGIMMSDSNASDVTDDDGDDDEEDDGLEYYYHSEPEIHVVDDTGDEMSPPAVPTVPGPNPASGRLTSATGAPSAGATGILSSSVGTTHVRPRHPLRKTSTLF